MIIVNGKVIQHEGAINSLVIGSNNITINGKKVTGDGASKEDGALSHISVQVTGDVGDLRVEGNEAQEGIEVKVEGKIEGNARVGQGNLTCGAIGGFAEANQGNLDVHGNVEGDASVKMGNLNAHAIKGSASVKMGNINAR